MTAQLYVAKSSRKRTKMKIPRPAVATVEIGHWPGTVVGVGVGAAVDVAPGVVELAVGAGAVVVEVEAVVVVVSAVVLVVPAVVVVLVDVSVVAVRRKMRKTQRQHTGSRAQVEVSVEVAACDRTHGAHSKTNTITQRLSMVVRCWEETPCA